MGHRERQILAIVASDNTFAVRDVRGERMWAGRCIHCRSTLVVSLAGETGPGVTIEHVHARGQGGTDALENLALACARCNHEKGVRHDRKKVPDARALEVQEALEAERRKRWRQPGE